MKRVVKIQFFGSSYNYRYLWDGEPLSPSDVVIVPATERLAVAQVIEDYVKPVVDQPATKWIVQKVDVKSYQERLAKDKQIAELKAKLAAKVSKFKDEQVLILLAQTDSEAASYIDELATLEGK